jgi:ribosomal protein L37E
MSEAQPTAALLSENAIQVEVYCPRCGYNLFGTAGPRCPECGFDLARLRSGECRLPWEHRASRGWFRTFWATVWYVTLREPKLHEAFADRVRYRDARRFQLAVIAHLLVPLVVVAGLAFLMRTLLADADAATPNPRYELADDPYAYLAMWAGESTRAGWPIAVGAALFLIFLLALTGVPSYFFHPRRLPVHLQNNALALSYYTCAPIAWAIPSHLLLVVLLAIIVDVWDRADAGTGLSRTDTNIAAVTITIVTVFAAWWLVLLRLARVTMRSLPWRQPIIGLAVPILWLLLTALGVGVVLASREVSAVLSAALEG